MKSIVIFVLLLEFIVINADSSNNIRIQKFIRKIKGLKRGDVRHLNETESDSSLYDTSEPETEAIETTPTTTRPSTSKTNKTLSLHGFGGFKQPEENSSTITWNCYFRYYSGKKPKTITYTIYVIVIFRRRLEEKTVQKEVQCSLIGELNDYLQYDCNANLDNEVKLNNIEKISVEPTSMAFVYEDGEVVKNNELDIPITFNDEATQQMENLIEQKEDPYEELISNPIITFYLGTLDVSTPPKFYVRGLQLFNPETESKIRELIDEEATGKYIFTFFDLFTNESKNVSCIVSSSNGEQSYDLECSPTLPFGAHINNGIGHGAEEKNKKYIAQIEIESDEVILEDSQTPSNRAYYRKNSKGLSGAAIAGIVIVCVVALVAVSVLFFLLRKKSKTVIQEESNVSSVINL